MKERLIKTDKNGTKYFERYYPCQRCGGVGFIKSYDYIDGGRCFDCGGSGMGTWKVEKEYTPEYEAKLNARREKRLADKVAKAKIGADEDNKEFFENNGFNQDGITYVALGNTYDIKEKLKANGYKYTNTVGWHGAEPLDGIGTVEISVDDIYFKDYSDRYKWNNFKRADEETYTEKIKKANAEYINESSDSGYYGEVGKRYDLELVYDNSVSWKQTYNYRTQTYYRHIFKDKAGNTFTWKTQEVMCLTVTDDKGFHSYRKIEKGEIASIKGTIKEHNVYNGIRQNELSRCKILGVK